MGWYEALKDGITVAQKADNIELVQTLIEAQKEMMDLVETNRELREQKQKLKEQLQLRAAMKFRDNQYWLDLPGQTPEGPYCSTCFDVDKNLVRMHGSSSGWIYCDYCTYRR